MPNGSTPRVGMKISQVTNVMMTPAASDRRMYLWGVLDQGTLGQSGAIFGRHASQCRRALCQIHLCQIEDDVGDDGSGFGDGCCVILSLKLLPPPPPSPPPHPPPCCRYLHPHRVPECTCRQLISQPATIGQSVSTGLSAHRHLPWHWLSSPKRYA